MTNPPDRANHPKRRPLSSAQLNELANNIRVAGGKHLAPKGVAMQGVREKPALGNVHLAYTGGHINLEEAQDLNPKYDPSKKRENQIHAIQQRNVDKDPAGERAKRRESYSARKKKKGIA